MCSSDLAGAQSNLGAMYETGQGVAEDDVEAVKWYRKAAEQGHATAQYNLGVMHANGRGVVQNYVLAYMWINLSRMQGDEDARKGMEMLVDRMTKEQIAEAQKMAREWPAHRANE